MILKTKIGDLYPLKASFSKSDKPTNNKLSFSLPVDYYSDFDINDDVYLYDESGNLLFNGFIVNRSLNVTDVATDLTLEANDRESLIYNRIWTEAFSEPVPFIIGSVISKVTADLKGVNLGRVNIKYVGFPRTDGIQVTITNHPEIEFTEADRINNTQAYQDYTALASTDKFITANFGAVNTPLYSLLKDVSTKLYTGLDDSFIYYLDESNTFIWYQSSAVTTLDTKYLISDYKLDDKQESKVNFLVIYCGTDLNGNPVYTYAYKDYSGTPNIQETIKDWSMIGNRLKSQYTDNDSLIDAMIAEAQAKAKSYFTLQTVGRIEGKFKTRSFDYRIGQQLNITHRYGTDGYKVLINSLHFSFDLQSGSTYEYGFEQMLR